MNKLLYKILSPLLAINLKLPKVQGPCFLLGSAPDPILPEGYTSEWQFWSVNASQATAAQLGLKIPDLTVMSAQMLGDKPENLAGKTALKGKETRNLVLIERGFSVQEVRQILDDIQYSAAQCYPLSHFQRAAITQRSLGEELALGHGENKISTGVFAMILALRQSANPLVISGFSVNAHGHSYNQHNHKRGHITCDIRALSLMASKQFPIYTTSPSLNEATGIPLWKNKNPNIL